MTRAALDAACEDQVKRSLASLKLKDPKKSQTLKNRLSNLLTVAKYGLDDPEVTAHVKLMRIAYHEYMVSQKDLTDEADKTCRMLRDNPHLAATYVNSPSTLARLAEQDLARARAASDESAEDAALRLYAAAAASALQLSRPLRTSNVIRIRHRGSAEIAETSLG